VVGVWVRSEVVAVDVVDAGTPEWRGSWRVMRSSSSRNVVKPQCENSLKITTSKRGDTPRFE
jgi:hypothetical protein